MPPQSNPPSNEPPEEPPPGPAFEWPRRWYAEFETREVRKARERAERAARRADRASRRVREAQERSDRRSGARTLVDAAGDAATAALTAVSAAADEAQARLATKARMRELEQALITARAGGSVEVAPPSHEEALKLADQVDPRSSGASLVRGLGFIFAGLTAFTMMSIGGFGLLGLIVPAAILIAGGSIGGRIQETDRIGRAASIQLELARASLGATRQASGTAQGAEAARPPVTGAATTAAVAIPPKLLENGDPRTRAEVLAVLDRLIANVTGWVSETDMATLRRIRESATVAMPATNEPLDLTDHDVWLLRQICIDYLPGALEHFIVLPQDLASEPVLDGRSARQVLDEQLALIETRLDEMATESYRREADGLLTHARFVADSLRPDPFEKWVDKGASKVAEPVPVAAEPVHIDEASVTTEKVVTQERVRERA
jgi:hypothetical protein